MAPDGTIDLVHRLIAPVRVLNVSKPVHVQLPGIVHRFAKGHTSSSSIAATDSRLPQRERPCSRRRRAPAVRIRRLLRLPVVK